MPRAVAGLPVPLVIAVFLVLIHAGSGPALAVEIPQSAQAQALLLPAPLLDYPTLIHRFPQLSTRYDSAFLVSHSSYGSLTTGGALGRSGARAAFLFVQSRDPWTSLEGYSNSRLFQVGLGSAWGSLRTGLALRGSLDGNETVYRDENSSAERWGSTRTRDDIVEVGIGLGWGTGPTMWDLAIEVTSLDQTMRSSSYTVEADDDVFQWRASVKRRKDPIVGAALRGRVPIDGKGEILLGGYWAGRHMHWMERGDYESIDMVEGAPYADNWGFDGAVAGPVSKIDWLAVSASYNSYRRFEVYADAYELTTALRTRRFGCVSLSARERILSRLEAYVGVRGSYVLSRTDVARGAAESYQHFRATQETTEAFGDESAWGLSYEWRNFRFAGELRTTPNLDDLVIGADAIVRF